MVCEDDAAVLDPLGRVFEHDGRMVAVVAAAETQMWQLEPVPGWASWISGSPTRTVGMSA
jgi:hypothetical protein